MGFAGPKHRVAVVDDEGVIASTIALILGHNGYDADSYTDPRVALESFHSKTPDLLLTDVAMPFMNGVELAMQVRELCPDCRILLFTGHTDPSTLFQEAHRKGYSFELRSKPIHPLALLQYLGQILPVRVS